MDDEQGISKFISGHPVAHNITLGMSALNSTSEAVIRTILTALCDDQKVRRRALYYLHKLDPQTVQEKVNNRTNPTAPITGKRERKEGTSICVYCECAFDEADNRKRDCRYHSGKMVPIRTWRVKDEFDLQHLEDCKRWKPEEFTWTCCGHEGWAPPCCLSRHKSSRYASDYDSTPEPEKDEAGDGEDDGENEDEAEDDGVNEDEAGEDVEIIVISSDDDDGGGEE